MYNIGVVSSNPEIENTTYIKALKESEYNVHYLKEKHKWERQTCELDALIIEEEESDNQMSLICESIIKIREQTSALVWVLSQNTDKSTRIVYLKLGADAIIDTSIDSEELVLLIKGHLKRYSEKNKEDLKFMKRLRFKNPMYLRRSNLFTLILACY